LFIFSSGQLQEWAHMHKEPKESAEEGIPLDEKKQMLKETVQF
jgi:hypothetical protein